MKRDLPLKDRGKKRKLGQARKSDSAGENRGLKGQIVRFCRERGVDLVGFAPVERWDEANEVPPDFRPRAIWPPAKTVIVLGLEMPLPVVETTPSVGHMEMYKTANAELDQLAYDLTRYLNRLGHASFFFPRDGYGSMRALRENNRAAFAHIPAARYAGLGTIGASHNLLTPEFGPRVRFVSVFTSAQIPPDPMIEKDLCIKCEACAKCCPKKAIRMRSDRVIGDYDDQACLEMAEELVARRCFPCGICTKVCPIGKDRTIYKEPGVMKKYLREAEALAANPEDPEYKAWTHLRKYGVARGKKQGGKE
jgi:epoxyqueuosine reductase